MTKRLESAASTVIEGKLPEGSEGLTKFVLLLALSSLLQLTLYCRRIAWLTKSTLAANELAEKHHAELKDLRIKFDVEFPAEEVVSLSTSSFAAFGADDQGRQDELDE